MRSIVRGGGRAMSLVIAASVLAAPGLAHPESSERPDVEKEDPAGASLALGVASGWQARNDYGDRIRYALAPELVGYGYVGTGSERLFLRPGFRIGYVGLRPAEMPESVRYVERDVTMAAEFGALYDGLVIPSASLGAGATLRRLELDIGEPIEPREEPTSRWELFPVAYAQVGAGVPFARGLFVLEPFARAELTVGDDRARWRYGVDLTFALP